VVDVFAVAESWVQWAVGSHGDEIDLVAYYGSYAQGVATERSDLDICYIPADGASPPVARTVLVDGILFDFWPITWATLEDFATGRCRGWAHAPALVHHAKLLYSRSAAATARLDRLKQRVLDLQQPTARAEMLERALASYRDVCTRLGSLHLAAAAGHLTDVRHAGWGLIAAVMECLTQANQVFLDRTASALPGRLPALRVRPPDLDRLLEVIATSPDSAEVLAAAGVLAVGTREALRQARTTEPSRAAATEQLADAYPEVRDQLRKVTTACEGQDMAGASMAAWSLQEGAAAMLAPLGGEPTDSSLDLLTDRSGTYRQIGLPDLLGSDLADLAAMAALAERWDARLRRWLGEQGVPLNEYKTIGEFAASLA
jgi:hypothetical protein